MHAFCLTFPYALFLGLGGLIGYLKKGSLMSLIAGTGSGVVLGLLGYMHYVQWQQTARVSNKWTLSSLLISTSLAFSMGRRALESGATAPSVIAAVSLLMSLFYGYRLAVPVKPPKAP